MRIVHASDWHGQWYPLQKADLYIITGDMYPNDPIVMNYTRQIIVEREIAFQNRWVDRMLKNHEPEGFKKKFFKNPDAPVVTCGGNHDFIGFSRLFEGTEHYEIEFGIEWYNVLGLKIGGSRGINYICGEWNDEMHDPDLDEKFGYLNGDLDIVVSHAPPLGIRDGFFGEHYGVRALNTYINRCQYEEGWRLPKLFCFGHVHNQHGIEYKDCGGEKVIFSNAATRHQVIDLDV
jgi:Icc-related predicted phosphoesterase